MIWLYATCAFAGIALLTVLLQALWRACEITDPNEKQRIALDCYAASRRES